jgi:hypothetical protein
VNTDAALWESWPIEVLTSEVESFADRAEALTGASEQELVLALGPPGDQTTPGIRVEDRHGALQFQADCDLNYFGLLDHTVVRFSMLQGRVARVGYFPKWKQCPPEFAAELLGNVYAPE